MMGLYPAWVGLAVLAVCVAFTGLLFFLLPALASWLSED